MRFGPRALNLGDPVDRSAAWHPSNVWLPLVGAGSATLFDAVGRNHGTLTNGPTWGGSDASGLGAVVFDGSNDYVSFSQVGATSATLAIRFRRDRVGAAIQALAGTSDLNSLIYTGTSSEHSYNVSCGGSFYNGSPAGSIGLGWWQTLVVVVVDGQRMDVYLNGPKSSGTVGSGQMNVGAIGGFAGPPAFPLLGAIQSVWFWSGVALSDSQAAAFCLEADTGFPTLLRRVSPVSWFVGTGGGGGGGVSIPVVLHHRRMMGAA